MSIQIWFNHFSLPTRLAQKNIENWTGQWGLSNLLRGWKTRGMGRCKPVNNIPATSGDTVSSGGWRGRSPGGRSWRVSTRIDLTEIDR